jgi:hypothetical protein
VDTTRLSADLAVSVGGDDARPVLTAQDVRHRVPVWSAALPGPVLGVTGNGIGISGIVYVALDASGSGAPQRLRVAAYYPASGQPLPETPVATIETKPCPETRCVSLAGRSLWQAGDVVVAVAAPWTARGSEPGTAERAQQVWVWTSR